MAFFYDVTKTDILTLYVVATEKGISAIHTSKEDFSAWCHQEQTVPEQNSLLLEPYLNQLHAYFLGEIKQFDLPIDLQFGTVFQRQVWAALQQVPYGETVSYSDIARMINNPKAVRAIGNANGKNPIPIVIPCHRVIQKDGSLGGYSSGLAMKKLLLALEKQHQ